ncbi:hypothetical protein ACWD4J_34650 [Streptomyces sp. NPDC002577]
MRTTRALAVSAAAVVALGLAAPSAMAGGDDSNNNGSLPNGNSPNGPGLNGIPGFNDSGPGGLGGFPGNGLGGFPGGGLGGFPGNGLGGFGGDGDRFPGGGLGGFGGDGDRFPGGGVGGFGGDGGRFPGSGLGGVSGIADEISVAPRVVRPGEHNVTVTIRGNVAGIACQLAGSTVESTPAGAFPRTRLRSSGGITASAAVNINRNARPGVYGVIAHCGDRTFVSGNELAVVGNRVGAERGRLPGGGGRPGIGPGNRLGGIGGGDDDHRGNRGNRGNEGPRNGVRAGLGGSLSGATAPDMAIGGGMVAAAVASGGVFWLRRRRG